MDDETQEPQEEPALPLGTYAPFDISDQIEWTKDKLDEEGEELNLAENLRAMVVAACQRETLGRRLEIGQAWRLQLMDRGFHRLVPRKGGGWNIAFQGGNSGYDVYGGAALNNLYDLNIIGAHNDIIVNALTRDLPKTEFTAKTDNDASSTAAAAANKLKYILQEEANFKQACAMAARGYCTDERQAWYMRPVADAQRFGFEDDSEDVTPETEGTEPASKPSKKPRIQTVLDVFGKLEHKCQIACDDDTQSPYQIIATENDTARERAAFPWIAEKITGGSAGIAEIELDRVARQSIKLAIQGGLVTGQGTVNDTTRLRAWLTPSFYWDDSCNQKAREWFLKRFPKGILAVYSGVELAFCRNEAWQEVVVISHARTGKGQNRRALTEAYSGPNMILDNWIDLISKFFTSTVPSVFLDSKAFNVDQLRQRGYSPGRIEPFNSAIIPQGAVPMLQMPMPTHQPSLPDFIRFFAQDLAQLLTGAQLTLVGGESQVETTLGEAKMDNDSALTRLSEPWTATCKALSVVTMMGVSWNARVNKSKTFDKVIPGQGRLRIEMQQIQSELLTVAETDTNFPESWSDREERIWQMIQVAPQNPLLMTLLTNPANSKQIKNATRMGLSIPNADSWEKQQGEFAILLESPPKPNPQIDQMKTQMMQLKATMDQGAQEIRQNSSMGLPVDPQHGQALEQGLQAMQQLQQQMQQLPPFVSSVPIRPDMSENHMVEAACCYEKMNSPEGRRLAFAESMQEKAAFANLYLHWQEHTAMAAKLAAQNQQPVEPKVSITIPADKLPGQAQSEILAKGGVNVPPQAFDQMGPHEISHEVKGVNAQGAEEKVTTSLVGKQLN